MYDRGGDIGATNIFSLRDIGLQLAESYYSALHVKFQKMFA